MGPGGKGEKPAPGDCAPPKTAGSWEIGTLNKDIQKDVYIRYVFYCLQDKNKVLFSVRKHLNHCFTPPGKAGLGSPDSHSLDRERQIKSLLPKVRAGKS